MKTFKQLKEELEAFKRKPNIVHAAKFTGNPEDLPDEIKNHKMFSASKDSCFINTLEGKMKVSKGDFIVIGIKDDMFPVKPDIFKLNYSKE